MIKKEKMDLYQQELIDHYENPRNKGAFEKADFYSGEHSSSCGDTVSIEGLVEGDKIKDLRFQGKGCIISQASPSLLTEKYKNAPIEEVLALKRKDIIEIIGMKLGPTRLKCALLGLYALQHGLKEYLKNKK